MVSHRKLIFWNIVVCKKVLLAIFDTCFEVVNLLKTFQQPEWNATWTLIRWPLLNNNRNYQVLARTWTNWGPVHCLWECKLVQPLLKTIQQVQKTLNMELPYLFSYFTTWYISKIIQCRDSRTHCLSMSTPALFAIAKRWKLPKCLSMNKWTNKWISKIGYTHIRYKVIQS